MKRPSSIRPSPFPVVSAGGNRLGGVSESTAEMFLSPVGGGGRVEMERRGEKQSIRSSLIEGGQAAVGQFVFLGEGEGMRSIDTIQSHLRDVLSSAVSELSSAAGEFVFLGGGEGNLEEEDAACRGFCVERPFSGTRFAMR